MSKVSRFDTGRNPTVFDGLQVVADVLDHFGATFPELLAVHLSTVNYALVLFERTVLSWGYISTFNLGKDVKTFNYLLS